MEYRSLGNSGLKVSVLSFGNSVSYYKVPNASEQEPLNFQCIQACINAGINFFDTSEAYGNGMSEQILGNNLKQGGWDRDELIISTKLMPSHGGLQGNSKKRMRVGIKNSLKRLSLDNVDILELHKLDDQVPLLSQVKTVNEFIEQDLAYYWCTNQCTSDQIIEIHKICEKYGFVPPIADQCQYNMLFRTDFEVNYAYLFDHYKMGAIVFGPQAGGILSGGYNNGTIPINSRFYSKPFVKKFRYQELYDEFIGWRQDKGVTMLNALKSIADDLECTQGVLALAWVIYNKDVSTGLFGAKTPQQIKENLQALNIVKKLDKIILERIEEALGNRPNPAIDYRKFEPMPCRR